MPGKGGAGRLTGLSRRLRPSLDLGRPHQSVLDVVGGSLQSSQASTEGVGGNPTLPPHSTGPLTRGF